MFLNTPYSSYNDLINSIKRKEVVLRVDVFHFVKAIDFINDAHISSFIVLSRFIPSVLVVIMSSILLKNVYLLFVIIPAVFCALYLRIGNFFSGLLATIGLFLISIHKYYFVSVLLLIPFLNEIGKRLSFMILSDRISRLVLNDERKFVEAYQNKLILIEKDGVFYSHE